MCPDLTGHILHRATQSHTAWPLQNGKTPSTEREGASKHLSTQQIMKAATGEIEFLTTTSLHTTLTGKNNVCGGRIGRGSVWERENKIAWMRKKGCLGLAQIQSLSHWRKAFQHINITLPHKETQASAGLLTCTNEGCRPLPTGHCLFIRGSLTVLFCNSVDKAPFQNNN